MEVCGRIWLAETTVVWYTIVSAPDSTRTSRRIAELSLQEQLPLQEGGKRAFFGRSLSLEKTPTVQYRTALFDNLKFGPYVRHQMEPNSIGYNCFENILISVNFYNFETILLEALSESPILY